MRTLIEVHDHDELSRVLVLSAARKLTVDLLGINARNLKTLAIDATILPRWRPWFQQRFP